MKKFYIKIILLFCVLISNLMSINAEELVDNGHSFNAYDNPVYYQYFDDYMNILGEEFNKIKYYRRNIFVKFDYKIHRDGTISEFSIDPLTNSPINIKKLKVLIENNLPPKFYEGMNKENVNISIVFYTSKYPDIYLIDYYPPRMNKEGVFYIKMERKI